MTRIHLKEKIFFFFISLVIILILIFFLVYKDVKKRVINNIYYVQKVLINQIVKNYKDFFEFTKNDLSMLAKSTEIINFNQKGKNLIREFYETHKSYYKGLSRISKNGIIVYTFPYYKNVIGKDVSSQEHNKFIIKYHKPILSDVFKAVQGYYTMAFAYPVLDKKEYKGSITLLIPFKDIFDRIIKNVRLSKNDLVWVINKDGTILYWPDKESKGKKIFEVVSKDSSFYKFLVKMFRRKEGNGIYNYRYRNNKMIKYYASFSFIQIDNNILFIGLSSPEKSIFTLMKSFLSKLFLILFSMFLIGLYFIYYVYRKEKSFYKAELELKTKKEIEDIKNYLDNIINNLPVGIIGIDKNLKINLWNKSMEKISKIASDKIRGEKIESLPDEYNFIKEYVLNVLSKRYSISENRIRRVFNRTKYFDLVVFPLFEEKELTSIIVILNDVTNLVRSEQRLLQSQKLGMIGNLASGIAHDFNNILMSMKASMELMRVSLEEKKILKKDSSLNENIEIIEKSINRAEEVVKQLLSFVHKDKSEMVNFDVRNSIENVLKFCKNSFSKSIKIIYKTIDKPMIIKGSPSQIEQALLNILINANHAMTIMRKKGEKEGGIITIVTKKIESGDTTFRVKADSNEFQEYYLISISDTGVGMDDITRAQIFDPFFTTKSKEEGSGLGLSMVNNIIYLHKGFITVYSEVGVGTVFNIYLPASNSGVIEKQNNKKISLVKGNGTILVVDDEDMILELSKKILSKAGYKVFTASNGETALKIFRKNMDKISLLIIDIAMPDKTGFDILKAIKKLKDDIKVIIITGFVKDDRIKFAKELGVKYVIQKPFSFVYLSKIIANIIKS